MVHEDDALRAVRAADELRDSLVSLNDELERNYGVSLQLRTGVNTGEVVAGTEERLVTGDAVNVAARLEQAAQPGEILIGEQTLRLARGAIEVEPVEPLTLKGKAEPLSAHRLLRVVEGAPAFERRCSPRWTPRGARPRARSLRRGRVRAALPAGHGARAARDRQVAVGPRGRRGADGRRGRSVRPLSPVRRGHHVLAARRDLPGGRRRGRARRRTLGRSTGLQEKRRTWLSAERRL
jgi:Adenylate and Guanylate cyclase catalytic domain